VLLCIDAAHLAYPVRRTGSADFWNQIRRLEQGPGPGKAAYNTRLVMAAAYGPQHMPELLTTTPVNIEHPDMVVTITPSSSGASLQLSGAEWSELWDNFMNATGLQLGSVIKDHAGRICSIEYASLVPHCLVCRCWLTNISAHSSLCVINDYLIRLMFCCSLGC
jgi:hypothetical protein